MSIESAGGAIDFGLNDADGAATQEESRAPSRSGELFSKAYRQLKQIAHRERARDNHTLNTTGLVHEVFLKLRMGADPDFAGVPQFIAYAARAMRHILLDRAIRKSRTKLGGDVKHVDVADSAAEQLVTDPALALQLDSALCVLEQADVRAARTFELHYFAGLELEKVAEILGVSKRTVDRDWRFARAYLGTQMQA
jgi:RNA polymerase sigma factor (TIGR02999 family)